MPIEKYVSRVTQIIIGSLSQDILNALALAINSLYLKLCNKRENMEPIESPPNDIDTLKKSMINELQTVLNDD